MSQYTIWPVSSGGGGGGSGTVTSVSMSVPNILSVAGSPITTSGTFALSLAAQTGNKVFAAPADGSSGTPTFRALVAADLPSAALTSAHLFVGNGSNVATDVAVSGDLTLANTGAFTIAASAITNAKVSASAAIDFSKLAALTSGNLLVGSAGNVAVSVAMSGDVTISNLGVTAIGSGKVTNAMLAGSIAFSNLAALTSAHILVGSAGNVATDVAVTGDVTISNAGVTAIGATKVTNAMLAGSIAASKLVGSDIATVGTITAGVWNGTAITDTYLATISTAGKVSNSATTATAASTASAIVARDASGDFAANIIKPGAGTASLPGLAYSGQTNTGMYFSIIAGSTYGLGLSANGTSYMALIPNTGAGNPYIRTSIKTLFADGAVSAPIIGFEGGLGGLYRSGNGLMSFTDGTNRILDFGANGITNLKGYVNGLRVVTASGAVTVATTDYIVVVNKSVAAATVVNLPGSPATGLTYVIKDGKGDANANNITITPAAGNIDGAGTYVMTVNYGSTMIAYNGTQWNVISNS